MPELPDIETYIAALRSRTVERRLEGLRLANPFLLRTVSPAPRELAGKRVRELRRIGKRIVFAFEDDLFAVLHLMVAGRLHWKAPGARLAGKQLLAGFDFADGTLTLTEAGSKRRASLHLFQGEEGLQVLDRGGLEVMTASLEQFRAALLRENHTLKRALTDPRLLSGIGNSYSDEILHRARLSPICWTTRLTDGEMECLFAAVREVLREWTERLTREAGESFPEKVTAFRPEMAVHGRYGRPCPACSTPVQRIVYSENECNYCPTCQTEGRLLADRSLSRLLGKDWPRTLTELEELYR